MSDPLFSPDAVRQGLEALVDELAARGASLNIQVVGGAAVMIQAGRETLSQDVDALYSPSSNIDEAIKAVAKTYNWPITWLNDAVTMFASHHDDVEDWKILITRAGVTVSVASCQLLLAMKLLAGRSRDIGDIVLLLRACDIVKRQEAIDIFEHYYPRESLNPRTVRILEDLLPV